VEPVLPGVNSGKKPTLLIVLVELVGEEMGERGAFEKIEDIKNRTTS
jgi:hypothetical protein